MRTPDCNLLRPDASASDVTRAMHLPPGVAVEDLVFREQARVSQFLRAWSAESGRDMAKAFVRNTACKRVLYAQYPVFMTDVIPHREVSSRGRGINSRIHLLRASSPEESLRFEAVSTYSVRGFRFRYALAVQYVLDSVGLGWQLIRPVVMLDRELLCRVRSAGPEGLQAFQELVRVLRRLVQLGCHDYVHGTVGDWLPPPTHLGGAYAELISERPHPPELDDWHRAARTPLPDTVVMSQAPAIPPLELYALLVHGQVMAHLWQRSQALRERVHALVDAMERGLRRVVAVAGSGNARWSSAVPEYFSTLAGWFLASALILDSPRMASALKRLPEERARRVQANLAGVHHGMFRLAGRVAPARFPWAGDVIPIHEVERAYASGLAEPCLREHQRLRDRLIDVTGTHGPFARLALSGAWSQTADLPEPIAA